MKVAGWEGRLSAVLSDAVNRPFVYGEHDCTLFAARCADAVWGCDIESKHKGRYKTQRGALGRVGRLGGFSEALSTEGFKRVPAPFSQRGDVIVIDQDGREALGVNISGGIAAAGVDGLVVMPMTKAKEVWRK